MKRCNHKHELFDGFHLDAVPECDSTVDERRSRARIRVVPSGVPVDTVTNNGVVVACHSLPVAGRVRGAGAKILGPNIAERKVVISFNDYRVVALRED